MRFFLNVTLPFKEPFFIKLSLFNHFFLLKILFSSNNFVSLKLFFSYINSSQTPLFDKIYPFLIPPPFSKQLGTDLFMHLLKQLPASLHDHHLLI